MKHCKLLQILLNYWWKYNVWYKYKDGRTFCSASVSHLSCNFFFFFFIFYYHNSGDKRGNICSAHFTGPGFNRWSHFIFTPNWARSIKYFFEYFILYYVTIDILLSLCCSIYIYIYIILKNRFITIELKNQSKHLSLSTIHKP